METLSLPRSFSTTPSTHCFTPPRPWPVPSSFLSAVTSNDVQAHHHRCRCHFAGLHVGRRCRASARGSLTFRRVRERSALHHFACRIAPHESGLHRPGGRHLLDARRSIFRPKAFRRRDAVSTALSFVGHHHRARSSPARRL